MDDENDIRLLDSKDDKNHLLEKELLLVLKQEKIENHLLNLLSLKELKTKPLYVYSFLIIHSLINGKITQKMILCE